jgi:hypothetical protein
MTLKLMILQYNAHVLAGSHNKTEGYQAYR